VLYLVICLLITAGIMGTSSGHRRVYPDDVPTKSRRGREEKAGNKRELRKIYEWKDTV